MHDAALAHLARFAATQAGLLRVLHRRIGRWAVRAEAEGSDPDLVRRQVAEARAHAAEVVDQLVRSGVLDDAGFAGSRARSLTRAGRSRRAIEAHLAARGVSSADVGDALPDDPDAELAAALLQARRRRIGPFSMQEDEAAADPQGRQKALAALARAGFGRDVAERALAMEREEAEERILRLRRET